MIPPYERNITGVKSAYAGDQPPHRKDQPMTTTTTPDRFSTVPDEHTLQATVVALEEHGFSVEVVDDFETARDAVLARIPHGSSVMTNTSVTLADSGIADVINNGGPYESARNRMFALDFETQAQQMKAVGGQPDYALGSVHAITRDGTLVIASASGSQLASYAWGAANVIFVVGAQKLVPHRGRGARADLPAQPGPRGRPGDRRVRAAQPGGEATGNPPGAAGPHPHCPHPPSGRVLTPERSRLAALAAGQARPVGARLALVRPVAIHRHLRRPGRDHADPAPPLPRQVCAGDRRT
jgi:hypothetical protein